MAFTNMSLKFRTERVRFYAKEGNFVEVDLRVAKCFGVVKKMLADGSLKDLKVKPGEVNASKVPIHILRIMVQWVTAHLGDDLENYAMRYNDNYLQIQQNTPVDSILDGLEKLVLFELANGAYHLEVQKLLVVSCYAISKLLKGKQADEMRAIMYDVNYNESVNLWREIDKDLGTDGF